MKTKNVTYPCKRDRYIHACQECEFLGTWETRGGDVHDLYIHTLTTGEGHDYGILGWVFTDRVGYGKQDCRTEMVFAGGGVAKADKLVKDPAFSVAWELATAAGALDLSKMVEAV